MTEQESTFSGFMRNGRRLTDAQMSRREAVQRLVATGGAAAVATAMTQRVFAASQATPSSGATPVAAYDGPLAAEQVMKLPTGEPTTMDPGISYGDSELDIFFNIFDGLTGIDQQTGEVVPRVAERFEPNEDGSEYTFYLRQDVTWSDGTPINANDFAYSWKRVLDPETLSEYAGGITPFIKGAEAIANGEAELDTLGVEVVDDYTLKVSLVGPMLFFPKLTATWTYYPVPRHIIDEVGDGWTDTGAGMVSNGPFVMTEWNHNQSIILQRNASYYGEAPTLERAEYSIFEDASTQAYIAFENDEVDYAAPEGADLDRAIADPEASKNLLQFALSNCFFVVCDCSHSPTDTIQFRQALYKALDRDALANTVLRGQFLPAYTVMAPDIPGNNPDAALTESPEEAAQLLADAGIDPASINLELTYISTPARYKTVAEYLQATWQDVLGITVTLAPIEDATYIDWRASRETQPFGVYTGTWGSDYADPANWLNQNFTSQADHYRNHWQNDEFDTIAAEAVSNTDPEARIAEYQQAEEILVSEAPIIPMYRSKAVRAIKPWVKDIYFQPVLSVVHLRTIKIAEH